MPTHVPHSWSTGTSHATCLLLLLSGALVGCAAEEQESSSGAPEEAATSETRAAVTVEPTPSPRPPDPPGPPPMEDLLDRSVGEPLEIPEPLASRWRYWQHVGGDQTLLTGGDHGEGWPALGDRLLEWTDLLAGHGVTPQLLTAGLLEELEDLRTELLAWEDWTGDADLDRRHVHVMIAAEHGLVRLWLELARLLDATRPMPGERVERDEQRLMDALVRWNGDPQVVALLTPPLVAYDKLADALVRYQGISDAGGFVALPGARAFKRARPKRRHKDLWLLRQRLAQEDRLGAGEGEIWDGALTQALERAREAHQLPRRRGQKLLGDKLLKALAIPIDQRLRSLERNLARLRNSALQDQPYAIYVNLPDFHGEVWDGPERLFRFKVVIGNRKKDEGMMVNATPTLTARIKAAIYNPYWNVPRRIYEEELLPESEEWIAKQVAAMAAAAQAEPTSEEAVAQEMTVTTSETPPAGAQESPDQEGGEAATEVPDYWETHSYEVMFPDNPRRMYVRRKPGPGNALGKVKFIFDNRYAVYLHDTPVKGKFHHVRRAFSHGCMRVEKPLDLARLLLERDGTWPMTKRYKVLRHEKRTQINLRSKVWLVVDYVTARVADDGRVHWLMDVYGRDKMRLAER